MANQKSLEERIREHEWPVPEKFHAGCTYLYVPIEQYSAHTENGWVFIGLTEKFEGKEYFCLRSGEPLTHIRPHQTSCDLEVWVPDKNHPSKMNPDLRQDRAGVATTL